MAAVEALERGKFVRDLRDLFTLTRTHGPEPDPERLLVLTSRLGRLDSHELLNLIIEARRGGVI